jgi:hypothetical protein
MSFLRYPHLERLGNIEVEAIELGTAYEAGAFLT